jgi:hypothetical protein
MYSYNDLICKLKMADNVTNRKQLKAIVNALIKNGNATVEKQLIKVDINYVIYLWEIVNNLGCYFDYKYNTKIDLTKFIFYMINENIVNLNAIFCPGYTKTGYKDYIGNNNSTRLETLNKLKDYLKKNNVDAKLNITLADIFLENTNSELNPNWKNELELHIQKFIEKSRENFDLNEIIILSRIFTEEKYIKGYIDEKIIKNKTYYNFLKNNLEFYNKMGWNESEIQNRNDKLYTIYNIISEYINNQTNGIYLPMETMYSRSKVMTMNDVCTMYLHK